jgi:YD repeat-containing protein
VASTILQLILQILEGILAEQPTAGQAPADLQTENTALMHALTDTLTGIHIQSAKAATGGTINIGGVQINILQIIIQIIQAILLQSSGSASSSLPASTENEAKVVLEPHVLEPRVTSDSITYTIDTLGRITKATYASGHSVTYVYDSVGNRTSLVASA